MKWLIIILVVLAVLIIAGLVWMAVQRKQKEHARTRASELRSEAATTAQDHDVQRARAREAEAEAERLRAQAEQAEVRARDERTSYDQVRAHQEDRIREADRLDPDVDHKSDDYVPETTERPRGAGTTDPGGTPPTSPGEHRA